jgi:hypothetical protein
MVWTRYGRAKVSNPVGIEPRSSKPWTVIRVTMCISYSFKVNGECVGVLSLREDNIKWLVAAREVY